MHKYLIISILSLLPLAAASADHLIGDLYYQITSDTTACVHRYVGVVAQEDAATVDSIFPVRQYARRQRAATPALAPLQAVSLAIPSEVTIDGRAYIVDEISRNAFSYFEDIASVSIPATVRLIPLNAFSYCYGLRSFTVDDNNPNYSATDGILMSKDGKSLCNFPCAYPADDYAIPSSVSNIYEYSFAGGRTLRRLTWGKNVRKVATHTFDGHAALEEIALSSGITTIEDYAFYGCTSLRTIDIPYTVKSLGRYVFEGCTALQTAFIGSGVSTLSIYLFYGCSSLESVILPPKLTSIGRYAFYGCGVLSDITLPATVKTIGESAFLGCARLGNQKLPTALKTIGTYAFANCKGIGRVDIPNSVTSIGRNAFANCTSLAAITVEEGNGEYRDIEGVLFTADGRQIITYPAGRQDVTYRMPEGTVDINIGAFSRTVHLRSLILPTTVTAIGDNAFEDCPSLQFVTFPATLTSIGRKAFYYCTNLRVVCLPLSVQSVGASAFVGCERVEIVRLPSSLTTVGENAFYCAAELPPGSEADPVSALRAVVSDSAVPPSMLAVFVNYAKCTLFVPAGSEDAYHSADTWKRFVSVKEIVPCDVDFNGSASVSDIMTTVGVVLGTDNNVYCPRAMDIDGSGSISVVDVMEMVKHVLGTEDL